MTQPTTLADATRLAQDIEHHLNQVLIGQRQVVREVLIALVSGGHVLIEGVPGLGKTLLVRSLGKALELDFNRIQFTPDLM
ncbi:MAG: MoxR family ATPase, partial [Alcanivorax sp.]|nr:MoxR family ATPase [Alcanivorax sp.]